MNRMTSKQFNQIMEELGLSRLAAAKALGLSERSVINYGNHKGTLPRWIELMVKGLVAEHQLDSKIKGLVAEHMAAKR
jgi:hypothetical protein